MDFELHPWAWSPNEPFLGYQGLNPLNDQVQCVFLGKDANFPTDEELNANGRARFLLRQYLNTPQDFFLENQNIHHPFRHINWHMPGHDGGRYHEKLERVLQIVAGPNQPIQPSNISILELLQRPTIGNSGRCSLFKQAVAGQTPQPNTQATHLGVINKVLCTPSKRVCVFKGFGGLWRAFTKTQREIIRQNAPALAALGEWFGNREVLGHPPEPIQAQVFVHTHFSWMISNAEIQAIAQFVGG